MRKKWKTADLTRMALLVALVSISSYIIIPLPFTAISITAQTLIINLIGLLLSPLQALCTVGTWLLLGFVGAPVFSGGKGGAAVLLGPTGGYLIGYLVAVVILSLLKGKTFHFIKYCILTILVGIPVIYLFGALYMKFTLSMDWKTLLVSAVLPFIPLDIIKAVLASYLAGPLQRVFRQNS